MRRALEREGGREGGQAAGREGGSERDGWWDETEGNRGETGRGSEIREGGREGGRRRWGREGERVGEV